MDTGYILEDITNNEVTYIKDYMKALFTPQEELEMTIAESFNMSHTNAEEYAKELKNKCMDEYSKELAMSRRKSSAAI